MREKWETINRREGREGGGRRPRGNEGGKIYAGVKRVMRETKKRWTRN